MLSDTYWYLYFLQRHIINSNSWWSVLWRPPTFVIVIQNLAMSTRSMSRLLSNFHWTSCHGSSAVSNNWLDIQQIFAKILVGTKIKDDPGQLLIFGTGFLSVQPPTAATTAVRCLTQIKHSTNWCSRWCCLWKSESEGNICFSGTFANNGFLSVQRLQLLWWPQIKQTCINSPN